MEQKHDSLSLDYSRIEVAVAAKHGNYGIGDFYEFVMSKHTRES